MNYGISSRYSLNVLSIILTCTFAVEALEPNVDATADVIRFMDQLSDQLDAARGEKTPVWPAPPKFVQPKPIPDDVIKERVQMVLKSPSPKKVIQETEQRLRFDPKFQFWVSKALIDSNRTKDFELLIRSGLLYVHEQLEEKSVVQYAIDQNNAAAVEICFKHGIDHKKHRIYAERRPASKEVIAVFERADNPPFLPPSRLTLTEDPMESWGKMKSDSSLDLIQIK